MRLHPYTLKPYGEDHVRRSPKTAELMPAIAAKTGDLPVWEF